MDIDSKTAEILQTVHPDLKARMLRIYQDVFANTGLAMRATSGLRSMEEQQRLWQIGRDSDGNVVGKIVTKSPPGRSLHSYGLAVDSCFVGDDPFWEKMAKTSTEGEKEADRRWVEFGRFAQLHGTQWGGNFPSIYDAPHVQMNYGLSLKQIQDIYKQGGLNGVWYKVDQILKEGG